MNDNYLNLVGLSRFVEKLKNTFATKQDLINMDSTTSDFVQNAVINEIAAIDAMIIKGTIGINGTVTELPTTYKIGWTYRVVTEGIYADQTCEIDDLIIALVDRNGTNNLNSDWRVLQRNIKLSVNPSTIPTAVGSIWITS